MDNNENKEEQVVVEQTETKEKKKFNPVILIVIAIVFLLLLVVGTIVLAIVGVFGFRFLKSSKKTVTSKVNVVEVNKYADYQLKDNALSKFDLYFLQLENNKKNNVYSPLSIKYALEMLNEGAKGNSKKQINNI